VSKKGGAPSQGKSAAGEKGSVHGVQGGDVSDQPQAVVVPRKGLRQNKDWGIATRKSG